MEFAEFNYCPTCGRKAVRENHLMTCGQIVIPTPSGETDIIAIVCAHSLPKERPKGPMTNFAYYISRKSLEASIRRFNIEKNEGLKKLGKSIINDLSEVERKLDEEKEE